MPDKIQHISKMTGAYQNGIGSYCQADFMGNDVSAITHELRAPLTSVRSLSEILRDNPQIDSRRRQEFLGIIIRETERLAHLLDDALDARNAFGMPQKTRMV